MDFGLYGEGKSNCMVDTGNDVAEVRGLKVVEASVGAVTSVNNELFVALNNLRQIHVYQADDLQFIRFLPIDGLGSQVFVVFNLVTALMVI